MKRKIPERNSILYKKTSDKAFNYQIYERIDEILLLTNSNYFYFRQLNNLGIIKYLLYYIIQNKI